MESAALRRFISSFCLFLVLIAHARSYGEAPRRTTVSQILQLPLRKGEHGRMVILEGVVTFYEPAEHTLFVADSTGAIFVRTSRILPIRKGDRVEVRGITVGSFRETIESNDIRIVGSEVLPKPRPATFPELMSGDRDCEYVTVTGTIRAATLQQAPDQPFLLLEVLMDGGYVSVHLESPEGLDARALLDSTVTLTGVSGGAFDGKFQLVGAVLYVDSPRDMRIDTKASADFVDLPLTPIGRIMGGYNIRERSRRVRVRGSVTLYEPGTRLVIEDQGKAILIQTHEQSALQLGDVVDATGFPDARGYSQSLDHGQFLRTAYTSPVQPQAVAWQEALSGKYAFNLVSLEGRLVDQVHEAQQDTLIVDAGGHIFSADYLHASWDGNQPVPLPSFPLGGQIRVTGVSFVQAGGPWHSPYSFDLAIRQPGDIAVLALPSWWTQRHLLYLISGLAGAVIAALFWGAFLRGRMRAQTNLLRRTMEEDAARERRLAFVERERGRVLEAINSLMPLDQVLGMIANFISEQMYGLCCWCVLSSGVTVGCINAYGIEPPGDGMPQTRRDINSSNGERLGVFILDNHHRPGDPLAGGELLELAARLAALAIDNRRLYEGLIHRSEYDQLTEVPNRFLLESRLAEALENARRHQHRFALIYIDLDQFKIVNDRHGHRIGDLYLQHVARRLSERLRSRDTLARVGGDEFIALIPSVRDRGEAHEIARRLEDCFDSPFHIDDLPLSGTASVGVAVYPGDGKDADELKRFADAAMYASKQQAERELELES